MSNQITIIQKARSLPRVREMRQEEVLNPVIALIGKIFLVAGQVPKSESDKAALKKDIQFIASELSRDIATRYSELTLEEISIAFDKGVRNDFGDYFGLNVRTFNNWITAYRDSPERLRAIEDQLRKKAIPSPTQPTTADLKRMRDETIIFGFNSYKRRGSFVGNPTQLYKYLEELELIKLSKSEKNDLISQASKFLEDEYKTISKKDISSTVRKALIETLHPNNRSQEKIVFKAKAIAIEAFYKNIVEKDLDIKELIK